MTAQTNSLIHPRLKKTYTLLLTAFVDLLAEKSFDEIYVTDICERAMIHRTTFYKHFEDKYQLLDFAFSELKNAFTLNLNTNHTFANPREYYLHVFRILLSLLTENQKLAKLLFLTNDNITLISRFQEFITNDVLIYISQTLKADGHCLDIPLPILVEFYVGGILNLSKWWFINGMSISQDELIHYADLLLDSKCFISSLNDSN